MHVGRAGDLLLALDAGLHLAGRDRFAFVEQSSQDVVDPVQAFVLRQIQNLQVLLHPGRFAQALDQLVVGYAEPRGGIQVVHVLVVHKRARLADQRIDDMAKVDCFLAVSEQPGHPLQALVAVPQFQVILVNMHLHLQTDVLAAHGVRILLDAHDAIRIHLQRHGRERTHPLRRQWAQGGTFFPEGGAARGVSRGDHLLDEGEVLGGAGEVPAATQTQRLVQRRFQVAMGGFDIAVFLRLPHVDAMAPDAVVRQQRRVLRSERLVTGEVVDRG